MPANLILTVSHEWQKFLEAASIIESVFFNVCHKMILAATFILKISEKIEAKHKSPCGDAQTHHQSALFNSFSLCLKKNPQQNGFTY